jgi:long-chain fatty acid transport protein
MDLPQNLGLGFANTALCEGRLLVALDLTYKLWDQADLYDAIYENQLVVQLGTQYTMGYYKFRAGYAWAENPLDAQPDVNVGGVPLGNLPAVRYTQSLLAITSQHRVSFGIGVSDVLPGIDLDMMAGGMFKDNEQLGEFTTSSIESYWIGFGMTWRFGRGAVTNLPVPDSWGG